MKVCLYVVYESADVHEKPRVLLLVLPSEMLKNQSFVNNSKTYELSMKKIKNNLKSIKQIFKKKTTPTSRGRPGSFSIVFLTSGTRAQAHIKREQFQKK